MYEAERYEYRVSGRYSYHAVDPISYDAANKETAHEAVFAGTKKDAERVASVLNQAFDKGMAYQREVTKQELKCEGYANYETSSVALWIHNDRNVLANCLTRARANGANTPSEQGLAAFTVWLQSWVEDQGPDTDSPFTEWINQAIAMVDWYELAKELYEQAKEN